MQFNGRKVEAELDTIVDAMLAEEVEYADIDGNDAGHGMSDRRDRQWRPRTVSRPIDIGPTPGSRQAYQKTRQNVA